MNFLLLFVRPHRILARPLQWLSFHFYFEIRSILLTRALLCWNGCWLGKPAGGWQKLSIHEHLERIQYKSVSGFDSGCGNQLSHRAETTCSSRKSEITEITFWCSISTINEQFFRLFCSQSNQINLKSVFALELHMFSSNLSFLRSYFFPTRYFCVHLTNLKHFGNFGHFFNHNHKIDVNICSHDPYLRHQTTSCICCWLRFRTIDNEKLVCFQFESSLMHVNAKNNWEIQTECNRIKHCQAL